MSIVKREFFVVVCNKCGEKLGYGDIDFCVFNDEAEAEELIDNCEWVLDSNGRVFCYDCCEEYGPDSG